jgi:pilus assembly protein Flp/PilA
MTRTLIALRTRMATRDDSGATAVEYGLMVSLIAVVIIGAVTLLGGELKTLFTTIQTKLGVANAAG